MAVSMLLHASEICAFIIANKRLEKVEIKSLGIAICHNQKKSWIKPFETSYKYSVLGRRFGQHENNQCTLYTIHGGMAKEAINK